MPFIASPHAGLPARSMMGMGLGMLSSLGGRISKADVMPRALLSLII